MSQACPVMIHSAALNSRKTFYVYTPKGYEDSNESYPVLYLLHGMYGSETDWIYKGSAVETIETMIEQGELPPTIVVVPNDGGYADGTFYVNWYDGSGNFEDYFLYDLVESVDRTFRTSRLPQERAIAGLSMGGYGAFVLALRNPGTWGVAASLSGALRQLKPETAGFHARMMGPHSGPYAMEHDLYRLSANCHETGTELKLYFDCGVDDFLIEDNRAFHHHLSALEFDHEYHEFEGEHTWQYWTEHLRDVCRFVGKAYQSASTNGQNA